VKLVYLANNRIPSEKANSLQIMQMCQAFQQNGAQVELVVPHRVQPTAMRSVEDPFAYYGISDLFRITRLPCLDTLETAPAPLQHPAFAVQSITFALSVAGYLASHRADVYYSRDPLSTVLLSLLPFSLRSRAVYESHTFPRPGARRRTHLWSARRLGRIVCITGGLAQEYLDGGIPRDRVLVAPDAVDPGRFDAMPSREDARRQVGIPLDAVVVAYTGHLYRWKGAHTLAEASRSLPPGYLVYLVGGTDEDIAAMRRHLAEKGLDRVRLAGRVPPNQVIPYLAAADLLALPNSGVDAISSRYTSPMKLFEYMAARRPIVASRLPSLQEVLRDGENARLVAADDPLDLARGITEIATSPEYAGRLADRAWQDVQNCSWAERARSILEFTRC